VLQSLHLQRTKNRLLADTLSADFGLPDFPRTDPIADCTALEVLALRHQLQVLQRSQPRHYWEYSHALDLSAKRLLAGLEGRIAGAQALLAIDT
jgi:hypothetical protein